jgi:uncharacterized membrane protein YhaH (DUF805 family)
MNFMEAVKSGLSNWSNFQGRSRRSAFWYWVLFAVAVGVAARLVDGILFGTGLIALLAGLAMLVPGIAIAFRRLHDGGRSAWWLLIAFIPFIGWAALIYFYVVDSQPGDNAYGPNPK